MRKKTKFLRVYNLIAFGLLSAPLYAQVDPSLYEQVQAIFNNENHACMKCHAPDDRKPFPETEAEWFAEDSKWISADRDPETSLIYTELRGNGGDMPPRRYVPLDDAEREKIAEWIRNGPSQTE